MANYVCMYVLIDPHRLMPHTHGSHLVHFSVREMTDIPSRLIDTLEFVYSVALPLQTIAEMRRLYYR